MKKKSNRPRASAWHCIVLAALCFAAYANSLGGDFVWDDQFQVVRNETIRSFANLPQAFTDSLWSFMYSQGGTGNEVFKRYYRPIHTLLYMVAYAIGGLSPSAFHFMNVTLHAGATMLAYVLCIQLGLESLTALFAAGLFATHPVHTESVSWIAGVGDIACAVFYFGGLCAFLAHVKGRKTKYLWLAAMCFFGALLSKEAGVTFPIAAGLLYLAVTREKARLKDAASLALPFVIVAGIYAALRVNAVGLSIPGVIQSQATLWDWATLAIWVVGRYLQYAIVPYPLSAQHVVALHFSDRVISTIVFGLVVAAAATGLWIVRRKLPQGWIWAGVFTAALLPVLYFQGSGILFAERYLYIPSLGIAVLIAVILRRIHERAGTIALVSMLAVFFIWTVVRNKDWQNDATLYARTLQTEPGSVKFWNNLGLIYLERNENQRAKEHFEQAAQHAGDQRFMQDRYEQYRISLGLGIIASREARFEDAKTLLNKALQFEPQGDGAYATLAGISINERDFPKAIALMNKALEINPKSELNRDYLGVALLNQGEYQQAIASFREALRINPEYQPAKQHLDFALQNLKP
jgi:tetratricopeptide (TPR) repeat protein